VPQRAVTEMQGKFLIAVVDAANKVEVRPVKPGERIGSDWIIAEGLNPGDKIVVEGTQKVRPGAVIETQAYTPAAAATEKPGEKPAPAAAPEAAKKG